MSIRTSTSKTTIDRRVLLWALTGVVASCRTVGQGTPSSVSGEGRAPVLRKRWIPGAKAEHQEKYVKAVEVLKANDAKFPGSLAKNMKDPAFYLSWKGLVAIHEKSCQHKNWYILPYHRLYLLYFEAACQAVLDDPTFALPYWDWSVDQELPIEFYEIESLKSERDLKQGDKLFAGAISPSVIQPIMASGDFINFHSGPLNPLAPQEIQGNFERTPHDSVHNTVGGIMAHPMKSPNDPIFWLHHGNVDRLWSQWIRTHPESILPFLTLSEKEKKADPRRKLSWGETVIGLDMKGSSPSGWEGYEDILLAMIIQKMGGTVPGLPGFPGGGFPGGGLGGLPGDLGAGGNPFGPFQRFFVGSPTLKEGETVVKTQSPQDEILKQAEAMIKEQLRKEPALPLTEGPRNRSAAVSLPIKDLLATDKLPYFYDSEADGGPMISTIVRGAKTFVPPAKKDSFIEAKTELDNMSNGSRFISRLTLPADLRKPFARGDGTELRLTSFNIPLPKEEERARTTLLYFVLEEKDLARFPQNLGDTSEPWARKDWVGTQSFFETHSHKIFQTDGGETKFAGVIDIRDRINEILKTSASGEIVIIGVALDTKTLKAKSLFKTGDEVGTGLWISRP